MALSTSRPKWQPGRENVRELHEPLLRELTVAPLRLLRVLPTRGESRDETKGGIARLLRALDENIAGFERVARIRFKLAVPHPQVEEALAEVRRLALAVVEHRREFRAAIVFLSHNLDPTIEPPVADFYCSAVSGARPSSFLVPPTPRSILRLVGEVRALGADDGNAFLDFDTAAGTWRLPTTPTDASRVLTLLHTGSPIEIMTKPAVGTIYRVDSPPRGEQMRPDAATPGAVDDRASKAERVRVLLARWASEDISREPDWNVDNIERLAFRSPDSDPQSQPRGDDAGRRPA